MYNTSEFRCIQYTVTSCPHNKVTLIFRCDFLNHNNSVAIASKIASKHGLDNYMNDVKCTV